jgi:hypothetical protein
MTMAQTLEPYTIQFKTLLSPEHALSTREGAILMFLYDQTIIGNRLCRYLLVPSRRTV